MLSLVKFYAEWCKPCAAMQPVMDSIPEIYGDRVFITNCDIDANPQMTKEHHVRSIPTFLLFRDGIEVSRRAGGCSLSDMQGWLNEFLGDLQQDVLSESSEGSNEGSSPLLRGPSTSEDS